jgi:hypothetical protein
MGPSPAAAVDRIVAFGILPIYRTRTAAAFRARSGPLSTDGMAPESRRMAGILLLILSLVVLRYVDEASLSPGMKRFVRSAFPGAAILLPTAFFLSVLSPDATEHNRLIHLAHAGAVVLTTGFLALGVGLLRRPRPQA